MRITLGGQLAVEALQTADRHHVVGRLGHHMHNVDCFAQVLGFFLEASTLRVLVDVLMIDMECDVRRRVK